MAKKIIWKALFWMVAVIILIVTLSPIQELNIEIPFRIQALDKIVHLAIFLVLTLLLHLAYPRQSLRRIFIYLALYGIVIEILQHTLPLGRSFEWADWLFDMIGIAMGIGIISRFPRKFDTYSART